MLRAKSEGKKYEFDILKNFDFLGITITKESNERLGIQVRTVKGMSHVTMLRHVLSSKEVSIKIEFITYKVVIKPLLLYECESWEMMDTE